MLFALRQITLVILQAFVIQQMANANMKLLQMDLHATMETSVLKMILVNLENVLELIQLYVLP